MPETSSPLVDLNRQLAGAFGQDAVVELDRKFLFSNSADRAQLRGNLGNNWVHLTWEEQAAMFLDVMLMVSDEYWHLEHPLQAGGEDYELICGDGFPIKAQQQQQKTMSSSSNNVRIKRKIYPRYPKTPQQKRDQFEISPLMLLRLVL